MMDVIAHSPAALAIAFILGDQPVAPDVGTVRYTVQDQVGASLPDFIDVPIITTATTYQALLLISADAQTIAVGRRFERRTVVVGFQVQGLNAELRRLYRVVPDLPHTVTAQQVRGFIGIEPHELPDDEIDLVAAYFAVEADVGEAELAIALTSGTSTELDANTLVCMKAVLNVLPSAKQRMAQSEKNGVKEFSRVDLKELDKLGIEALRRYEEALGKIVVTTETTPSLFLTAVGTDAVTG